MMTQQPRAWAESLLVAYVDGQLDAAQAEAVEQALREDPEARAIVGVLRSSAAAVKHAYDDVLDQPLPPGLRDLFSDVRPDGRAQATSKVVAFQPRRTFVRHLLPLAASVAALMIGFAAGYAVFAQSGKFMLAGDDPRSEFYLAALQQALENGNSGASQDYADTAAKVSGTVTIVGSVATTHLGTCREFRHDATTNAGTETSFGIACRSADGTWQVEVDGASGG